MSIQNGDSSRQSGANELGIDESSIPRHVAMILDGNRRWAKQRGLQSCVKGHEEGAQTLKAVASRCQELGISALTVFAFSSENWKRSSTEVSALLSLMENTIATGLDELMEGGVKLTFFGELHRLPQSLQNSIARAHAKTANNTGLHFSVAVSYGGKQDIVSAAQKAASMVAAGTIKPEDITEELFESFLLTSPAMSQNGPPDLLIRTSGEMRLSNFMLWDLAYTELFFSPKLWPDFGAADVDTAVRTYATRDRRFGTSAAPAPQ